MIIHQCDLCSKATPQPIISVGKPWGGAELCQQCAKPVIEFLIKNELLEKSGLQALQMADKKLLS